MAGGEQSRPKDLHPLTHRSADSRIFYSLLAAGADGRFVLRNLPSGDDLVEADLPAPCA
jgi:hypothetical protein